MVHASPEVGSFVTAMRDTAAAKFLSLGYTVAHSDLYAMKFNPVLSGADFGAPRDREKPVYPLEQRHGFENGTLAEDIVSEIEKILAADLLVFTFPLYWFGTPAILKGWFDRVFISGTFYGGRRVYDRGGMVGKRALVAFSLGGREYMFGPGAIHDELQTGMMRHFFRGTLGYVGFKVLEPFTAFHVPYISHEARSGLLRDLQDYIGRLDELPAMQVPTLADFDDRFMPLGTGKA